MLRTIGVRSIADLFESLPPEVLLRESLRLPPPLDEFNLTKHMSEVAGLNSTTDDLICFLGAGIYDHFRPAVVDALASRGEFLTSYTPYQPELSQGMLQAIYEFQSLMCIITGMDMANASMYDAATAVAEAALMLVEVTGRRRVLVSRAVHPHYRQVLRTYLTAADVDCVEVMSPDGVTDGTHLAACAATPSACVVVQNPTFFGCVEDTAAVQALSVESAMRTVVCADPISLALLKPPGEYGVDVVVGEGQPLGIPMAFGGPLLGFFAFRAEYQRKFPGRIVGKTHDIDGRRAFTMTLRTREQDIRREKATSNICTNEALLALMASVYLAALGPSGLRQVAELCVQKAHYAADVLSSVPGIALAFSQPFVREFTLIVDTRRSVHDICRRLYENGILAGYPTDTDYPELPNSLLVSVTEKRTRSDIDRFADCLRAAMEGQAG
jgi:glycine dehydrogenase subunit 1